MHFQRPATLIARTSLGEIFGLHVLQLKNLAVVVDERDGQRNLRILHEEALDLLRDVLEEHAAILAEIFRLPEHQAPPP